jgi:hypothetical protein
MSNAELPAARTLRAAPLFQPLAAPHLSKLSQHAIRLFMKDREQYLAAVAERRSQPGGDDLQPLSLLSSFDRDIVRNLCLFGDLGQEVTLGAVTDAHLETWLNQFGEFPKEVASEAAVDSLVKGKLRMNLKEIDPVLRIMELFSSYVTLLRNNGVEWMLSENP